jgi:dephospho-CoA kinase
MTDLVTEIWVVSCSPEQQLRRIIERDNLSLEQAQARLNSQLPIQEKVTRADVVLDNSSTLDLNPKNAAALVISSPPIC